MLMILLLIFFGMIFLFFMIKSWWIFLCFLKFLYLIIF